MKINQWSNGGRFVKQEQWERWRAKQKLVTGSKHRDAFAGVRGYNPTKILRLYKNSRNLMHFGRKMVHNAVHNAF